MKAGILAGGMGSRFLEAGWDTPKPLIEVGGKPIIFHVLESLFEAGAGEVQILLNGDKRFDPVEASLRRRPEASRIRVIRKVTRSSFESFATLTDSLGEPPFVISTVDAIFPQESLRDFLDLRSYPPDCSLALAVTDLVHDEHPLWASLAEDGRIQELGDSVSPREVVTAGLYLVLRKLEDADAGRGYAALRQFLKHLIAMGVKVWGRKFRGCLDIDNPEDIDLAEAVLDSGWLKQFPGPLAP